MVAILIELPRVTGIVTLRLAVPTYPVAIQVLRVARLEAEVVALLGEALAIVGQLVGQIDHELHLTVGNDRSVEAPVAVPDVALDGPVPNMELEALVEIGLILEVVLQATPDPVSPDHEAHVNNSAINQWYSRGKIKHKLYYQ